MSELMNEQDLSHELMRIFAALSTPTLETVADEFSRAMERGARPYLRPAADAVRDILIVRSGGRP